MAHVRRQRRCSHQSGMALAVGLALLTIVSMLGLAGAGAARTELVLAQNSQFRQNAAAAASAGLEIAISRIADMPVESPPASFVEQLNLVDGSSGADISVRFAGIESGLKQEAGPVLVGAHFEITSTGRSGRRARVVQKQGIMRVIPAIALADETLGSLAPVACDPLAGDRCAAPGELRRIYWQQTSG